MSKGGDGAASVERFGIEHIPEESRHGTPGRIFTLWFAANLTVADYVVGVLAVLVFGLTVGQAVPLLALGNLLGASFLGLSAAMGPSLGFPQMFTSRSSFGRRGNYVPGALNWVSTIGWFTVNTILATEAVRILAPWADFVAVAALLVAAQAAIAIFGHDLIHLFEKVMSIVLGVLFMLLFVLTIPRLGEALSYVPSGGSASAPALGAAATLLAVSFAYVMSWSPYASDYSRYLPTSVSRRRVALLALAGGGAASFSIELIGSLVGSLTHSFPLLPSGSIDYFGALNSFAGAWGPLAMLAIILGALAANALNIYTNSLSALVLDVKAKRWMTVVAGALVGFALAVLAGASFEAFFENFLLALDYWITPWLAIVLADCYLLGQTDVASLMDPREWRLDTLAVYALAILVSVPFMVPAATLGYPVGSLAWLFGGADFSYFVSFLVALALTVLRGRATSRKQGSL
jgi:nucleobase:cation symporter-1, NCS1 family